MKKFEQYSRDKPTEDEKHSSMKLAKAINFTTNESFDNTITPGIARLHQKTAQKGRTSVLNSGKKEKQVARVSFQKNPSLKVCKEFMPFGLKADKERHQKKIRSHKLNSMTRGSEQMDAFNLKNADNGEPPKLEGKIKKYLSFEDKERNSLKMLANQLVYIKNYTSNVL
jgi:hypothetical protein